MTHHPHVTHHRPKTTESEADEYGEDEFEEASYDSDDQKDQPNSSTKASPAKPNVVGLDLASYMESTVKPKANSESPVQKDLASINIDTDVTTLEGVYPKTGDKDQLLKRLNLGYTEALTPKNVLQTSQSNVELRSSKVLIPNGTPVKQGLSFEEPITASKSTMSHSDVDDQINAIYRKLELVQDKHDQQKALAAANSAVESGNGKATQQQLEAVNANAATQAENAARVDALLTELFPEKMEKIRGGKKKNKQAYGLGAVRSHDIAHYINVQNHNQAPSKYQQGISDEYAASITASGSNNYAPSGRHDTNDTSSPLSIEQQIKALRKELKAKEDKLARVTEHSMMMAAHMDKLKGENALLAQKLHEAQLELDAKDNRLAEALKQRKKATKKAAQKDAEGLSSLENENHQLREREQALMDAVEELSIQNQDLIIKLKESMQRELELSSKRAAMVSSTVANMTDGNHLPHINRALYAGDMRSQSEPSDGGAGKKGGAGGGAKKRK